MGVNSGSYHGAGEMITKLLVSRAIVLGAAVGLAAPAGAAPNPFSNLGCSCQTPGPATSPVGTDQINQGIQDGLTTDLSPVRGQR
jgi:hypothetical protein